MTWLSIFFLFYRKGNEENRKYLDVAIITGRGHPLTVGTESQTIDGRTMSFIRENATFASNIPQLAGRKRSFDEWRKHNNEMCGGLLSCWCLLSQWRESRRRDGNRGLWCQPDAQSACAPSAPPPDPTPWQLQQRFPRTPILPLERISPLQ